MRLRNQSIILRIVGALPATAPPTALAGLADLDHHQVPLIVPGVCLAVIAVRADTGIETEQTRGHGWDRRVRTNVDELGLRIEREDAPVEQP